MLNESFSKRILFLVAFLFASVLILFSLTNAPVPAFQYSFGVSAKTGTTAAGKDSKILSSPASLPEPTLEAHAYIVQIAGDLQPLLKRREEKELPPASLTKLLTALVASEILLPQDAVPFSQFAKVTDGKMSSVPAGESLPRDEALRLMLISSANDAALALAETAGTKLGGASFPERVALFVERMNERSREIGLMHSQFENPNGLDANGHFASAKDLARLAEYILKNHPELFEITRIVADEIHTDRAVYPITTTNELLQEYPGIQGGKTGYTDNAKGALILLYPVKTGQTAVIVLLGSHNRFEDGRRIIRWLEQHY